MSMGMAKPDDETSALVCALPLFRMLSEDDQRSVLQASGVKVLNPGEMLFSQEENATSFWILLSGRLEFYRISEDGEETLIRVADRNQAFSSGLTVSFDTHPFSARAVGHVRVLCGPRSLLRSIMVANGAAALDFAAALSGHLRDFADHIEEMRVLPALDRLKCFLDRVGVGTEDVSMTALPYKKVFIARAIGVAPETLSRLLAKMRFQKCSNHQHASQATAA